MTVASAPHHSPRPHPGKRAALFLIVAVALVAVALAWSTDGFTRSPWGIEWVDHYYYQKSY